MLRQLVSATLNPASKFPLGTFRINVTGCFLIGLIFTLIASKTLKLQQEVSGLFITGFLGRYTTFSAFSLEVINLLKEGEIQLTLLYIAVTLFLTIGITYLGMALARSF